MANVCERRDVKAHGQGGGGRLDQGAGWSMSVGCPSGTGGIVFSDDFVDCGRKINKKIVLEVPSRPCKVTVVCLGKMSDAGDKQQEV